VQCGVSCQVMRHPLAVALTLVLLIATGAAIAGEPDGRTPKPAIERATAGTQCVASPEVMRRDHPSMLKHQRDETVHRGVRESKSSLKACIGCHASAATGSVAQAKTDFCSSCHSYAAVQIDCFECHSSKAQRTTALAGAGKP
jgi:hypothetical protein